MTSFQAEARVPKVRGEAGGTEDRGGARGKVEQEGRRSQTEPKVLRDRDQRIVRKSKAHSERCLTKRSRRDEGAWWRHKDDGICWRRGREGGAKGELLGRRAKVE